MTKMPALTTMAVLVTMVWVAVGQPMTAAEAAAELQRCADVQFDEMVVDLFVNKVLPVWEMNRCPAKAAGV